MLQSKLFFNFFCVNQKASGVLLIQHKVAIFLQF